MYKLEARVINYPMDMDRLPHLIGINGQGITEFQETTGCVLRVCSITGVVTIFGIAPKPKLGMFEKVTNILKAINAGFDRWRAFRVLEEGMYLSFFSLCESKSFRGRNKKRTYRYASRIIGKNGDVRRTLENVSYTLIAVRPDEVAIIGYFAAVRGLIPMLQMLLDGRTLNTVLRKAELIDFRTQERDIKDLEISVIKEEEIELVEVVQEFNSVEVPSR